MNGRMDGQMTMRAVKVKDCAVRKTEEDVNSPVCFDIAWGRIASGLVAYNEYIQKKGKERRFTFRNHICTVLTVDHWRDNTWAIILHHVTIIIIIIIITSQWHSKLVGSPSQLTASPMQSSNPAIQVHTTSRHSIRQN